MTIGALVLAASGGWEAAACRGGFVGKFVSQERATVSFGERNWPQVGAKIQFRSRVMAIGARAPAWPPNND